MGQNLPLEDTYRTEEHSDFVCVVMKKDDNVIGKITDLGTLKEERNIKPIQSRRLGA